MKFNSTFGFLLFLSILFFAISCNKKGCTDSRAINYNQKAQKDDGSCVYEKLKPDSICEDSCRNGGECINNKCECTDGYTGKYCHIQKNPRYIKLMKVIINKYPPTDENGVCWDDEGDCFPPIEPYFRIHNSNETIFFRPWNHDYDNNFPIVYNNTYFSNLYGEVAKDTIFDYFKPHKFLLMDADAEDNVSNCYPDDSVAVTTGYFYEKGVGFPDSVLIQNQSGSYKLTLYLEYGF